MTTAVRPQADLGISISLNLPSPAQVSGGDSFPFSVVVTNAGPHTAIGATADVVIGTSAIIDIVPTGLCTAAANQPNHFTCLWAISLRRLQDPQFYRPRSSVCGLHRWKPDRSDAEVTSQTPDPTLPNHAMATSR